MKGIEALSRGGMLYNKQCRWKGCCEDLDLLLEMALSLSPLRNVHPMYLTASRVHKCECARANVCGLFLFVCLSCVCLYCQT